MENQFDEKMERTIPKLDLEFEPLEKAVVTEHDIPQEKINSVVAASSIPNNTPKLDITAPTQSPSIIKPTIQEPQAQTSVQTTSRVSVQMQTRTPEQAVVKPKIQMPKPKPMPVAPKIQMPEPKQIPAEPKIQMPEPKPIPVAPKIQMPELEPIPVAPKIQMPEPKPIQAEPKIQMPEPESIPVAPKIQIPEPEQIPVAPKIQMPEPKQIPIEPKIQIPEPEITSSTTTETELLHATPGTGINENNNTTPMNDLSTAISELEKDNTEIEKPDAASEIEGIEDLPPDDTLSEDNNEPAHHTEISPKRVIEHNPLVPPAMLGVLGGGQLGRMLAMAAKTMGYRITVWDPDPLSPAAEFADEHICAPFDDEEAKEKMSHCDAVTTEFENVSADSMRELANKTRVIPAGDMVAIAQNRIAEKAAIRKASLPVCPYQAIRSMEDVNERTPQLLPGILKTATMGYDGKGQRTIKTSAGLHMSLSSMMKDAPFVLERILDLRAELSVIVCRLDDEHITCFPPAENIHENGILSYSIVPARLPESLLSRAEVMAKHLAQKMDYVGVLAVEMFVVGEKQQLVVNEIAPRPHNSGHYTLDACNVSQFQQQVRILCDVPPIQTSLLSPCCMINLLGDLWKPDGSMPNWTPVMNDPDAYLHLYGKAEARSGRKMGHITVLAETSEQAFERAQKLFDEICFS